MCKKTGLGRKIKVLRTEFGLSQEMLAAKIGVDPKTVCYWECGKTWISAKFLFRIREEFGVSLAYFDV